MFRSRPLPILLAVLLASSLGGCVRSSTYNMALGDLARARAEHQATIAHFEGEVGQRDEELGARQRRIAQLEEELERRSAEVARLDSDLTVANTEVARLRMSLAQQGGQFTELQERLLALAQVEREIRERNRIYEDVLHQFRSLIDAGQLTVDIVRGRMVIRLPQDILFQSGSATLGADGTRTLREVGSVLAGLQDRVFQVEGHTDNVPISTPQFPSNWELSSARAMSVIRVLLQSGVQATRLSGAGYGEYQPVAPNDSPANRRLNRRIEIVMLPNLDVIATTPVPR